MTLDQIKIRSRSDQDGVGPGLQPARRAGWWLDGSYRRFSLVAVVVWLRVAAAASGVVWSCGETLADTLQMRLPQFPAINPGSFSDAG